jgi:hypothetical protein
MIRSSKILSAARDEQCTLCIAGVCNGDPATTVACHLPDESHGMALKAHDLLVVFACHKCHQAMDGQVRCHEFIAHKSFYLFRAFKRTLVRLMEKGVLALS